MFAPSAGVAGTSPVNLKVPKPSASLTGLPPVPSMPTSASTIPAAPSVKPPGLPGLASPQTVPSQAQVVQSPQAQGAADYLTNPGYQSALNSQTMGDAQIQANLNQVLSQALIGYGSPQLAGLLSQYGYTLNPEDAAAAQANTNAGTSTLARLNLANTNAKNAVVNNLTGRGIIDSGDLGYQLGQQGQNYANSIYDAQQAVLGGVGTAEQNALSQRQALQAQVDQALLAAWQSVIQNPGAYLTPTDYTNQGGGGGGGDNGGGGGGDNGGGGYQLPAVNQYGGPVPAVAPSTPAPQHATAPYTTPVAANRTGGSANARQGIFAIH